MANIDSTEGNVSRGPKVLRIGVVKAGRVVEERVMKTRGLVAVGSSERNEIVLGSHGMPARFELFQLEGDRYVMNFTTEMSGRVAIPGGMGELGDLRRSSLARDAGGYHQVKLDDASRGRIVLGDTAILFEFVDPPQRAVQARLPSTVMGGFGRNVDWTFSAFVAGSFVFFLGFGLYLSQLDPIVEPGLHAVPDDILRLVIEEPEPPEVEEDTPQTDESPTETAQNEQSHSESSQSQSHSDVANNAEAQASLAQDVANQVINEAIGTLSSDNVGNMVRDMFSGTSSSTDLAAMLQTASGSGASTGVGTRIRESGGGDGSGTTGNLGTLATSTVPVHRDNGTPAPEVDVRRGSVRSSGGPSNTGGSGVLDSSAVSSRLRSAQSAMQRCYEGLLATTPTLEGSVRASFTILESGSVTNVQVTAPNEALANCVRSTVSRLRFNPGPTGGPASFSNTFVFAQ